MTSKEYIEIAFNKFLISVYNMAHILLTGSAGFIGFHTANLLLKNNHHVVGIDNLNSYYDVQLKKDRLKLQGIDHIVERNKKISHENYTFQWTGLEEKEVIFELFKEYKFDYVIHLAAQAGVRYSLENPQTYIDSNVTGFLNILEACRAFPPKHLIFASSSSVYGLNSTYPFSENDSTDHPISLYAATKKANEMMAHTYAHLFQMPVTGLRFFSVYGPWGRPDMAPFIFAKNILAEKPIEVFNNGEMYRDFTFVGNIAESIYQLLDVIPAAHAEMNTDKLPSSESTAPYKIYNIGNNKPVKLVDFIDELEAAIGKKAIRDFKPMQPGDVIKTYADSSALYHAINYKPAKSFSEGIKEFADWFVMYHEGK